MKKLLLALALVALPALAGAQTRPINPTTVTFDSVDHALLTRYEVGFFLGTATTPVQTSSVPVAQVGGTGTTDRTLLLARPLFGTFTVKLRAVAPAAGGGEVMSAWSTATVPFDFSPLAPTPRGVQ